MERAQAEWSRQLDPLTDAYLRWKHGIERIDPLVEDIGENGWEATAMLMSCESRLFIVSHPWFKHPCFMRHFHGDYCPDQRFPSVEEDPYVNITLIKRGFLGSVPTYPTTVFALEALEDYRLEPLQCGSWTFLHKAKVLCHKHNVGAHFEDRASCSLFADMSCDAL